MPKKRCENALWGHSHSFRGGLSFGFPLKIPRGDLFWGSDFFWIFAENKQGDLLGGVILFGVCVGGIYHCSTATDVQQKHSYLGKLCSSFLHNSNLGGVAGICWDLSGFVAGGAWIWGYELHMLLFLFPSVSFLKLIATLDPPGRYHLFF